MRGLCKLNSNRHITHTGIDSLQLDAVPIGIPASQLGLARGLPIHFCATNAPQVTRRKEQAMAELSEKQRDKLSDDDFAFPKEHKEPIHDAGHVRNAIARFDGVTGVSNEERDEAWKRIRRAAQRFDVELDEKDWRDLFKRNDQPIPKG
jgi:hypothetical protein